MSFKSIKNRVLTEQKTRALNLVIDDDLIINIALKTVRFYEAYGLFANFNRDIEINENMELQNSEWAMLRPLFDLYLERENAYVLESSRSLGVESYGRTVSEIVADINAKEMELQSLAFCYDLETI